MKRIARGLVVLGLLGLSGVSQAAKISPEPAATLLLPYFEVDLSHNPPTLNTFFSINNAYAAPVLAHVILWSDLSVPVHTFNVYLTGYDVQTISLYDILVNGLLPQTSFSGQGCSGQLPPAPLSVPMRLHLQQSLTGRMSPMSGKCAGRNLGDNIARGYVTVDTVNQCTLLVPSDFSYFYTAATDDNVLWGDYFYLDTGQQTAEGHTLVHIPAENPPPPAGSYTFYGRYVGWTGVDKRRPLATSFATRFLLAGSVPRTDLIVWRDSKVIAMPFTCGTLPPWVPLRQEGIAVFDEQENLYMMPPGTYPFPAEAQRVKMNGPALPVPFAFGWINLNLNTVGGGPASDPNSAQGWVTVSMPAAPFNMGYEVIQLDNATNALHSVPP
jgi:hypothetical protein